MKNTFAKIQRVLSTDAFFYGIIALFIGQALWIAFAAVYPMAFDEAMHFGVTKLHADQLWLPFFTQQPAGADVYGAVVRDPSYLYHYLLAFPYTVIAFFTGDQTLQIIILRILNIALSLWALIIFRRVLLQARFSKAITNVALLAYTLIPIVPLLAAQINYDNLLLVFIGYICLAMFRCIEVMNKGVFPLKDITVFIILCLFASITKYAFLPIFFACCVFLLGLFIVKFRKKFHKIKEMCRGQLKKMPRKTVIFLTVFLLIGGGLFLERYATNSLMYKSPLADCGSILSKEQCMSYEAWQRNYEYAQQKPQDFTPINPVGYVSEWGYGMWYRLFFAINGDTVNDRYQNFPPLPVASFAAVAITALGLVGVAVNIRYIFKNNIKMLSLGVVAGIYIVVLFGKNYFSYVITGMPVALNGRYLLLVMIPFVALMALGISMLLRRYYRTRIAFAVVALLCLFNGGGIVPFLVYSSDTWYSPHSPAADMVKKVQKPLRKITPGVQL